MKKRLPIFLVLLVLLTFVAAEPAFANPALLLRGFGKTLLAVLAIPAHIVQDSVQMGPLFPVGILTGTVKGSVAMVQGVAGGLTDIVRGALPYAKYGLMFI